MGREEGKVAEGKRLLSSGGVIIYIKKTFLAAIKRKVFDIDIAMIYVLHKACFQIVR